MSEAELKQIQTVLSADDLAAVRGQSPTLVDGSHERSHGTARSRPNRRKTAV